MGRINYDKVNERIKIDQSLNQLGVDTTSADIRDMNVEQRQELITQQQMQTGQDSLNEITRIQDSLNQVNLEAERNTAYANPFVQQKGLEVGEEVRIALREFINYDKDVEESYSKVERDITNTLKLYGAKEDIAAPGTVEARMLYGGDKNLLISKDDFILANREYQQNIEALGVTKLANFAKRYAGVIFTPITLLQAVGVLPEKLLRQDPKGAQIHQYALELKNKLGNQYDVISEQFTADKAYLLDEDGNPSTGYQGFLDRKQNLQEVLQSYGDYNSKPYDMKKGLEDLELEEVLEGLDNVDDLHTTTRFRGRDIEQLFRYAEGEFPEPGPEMLGNISPFLSRQPKTKEYLTDIYYGEDPSMSPYEAFWPQATGGGVPGNLMPFTMDPFEIIPGIYKALDKLLVGAPEELEE
jgi:hypothetical protein